MSADLQSRVEAMRAQSRDNEDEKRRIVRAALDEAGLTKFLDEVRDVFGEDQVRLAALSTSRLVIGKPITRGIPLSEVAIGPPAATVQAAGASSRGGKR
jgi:hypothetical protein